MGSALTDAVLAELRADAARHDSNAFIDPALLRQAERLLPLVDHDWLERVIGGPVRGWRWLNNGGLHLAVQAAKVDAAHLAAVTDARNAAAQEQNRLVGEAALAARQAKVHEWAALRDRLPFPVVVWHNWTARHLEGYEQGADHIVLLEDFVAPWFTRDKRRPLCWTPSRSHPLRYVHGNTGDEKRVPTCKVCLRRAAKLAV